MLEQKICPATGKVCYSQKEAGNVIRRLKRHRVGHKNKTIPMRHYYCQECGTYHLTHWKQRARGKGVGDAKKRDL